MLHFFKKYRIFFLTMGVIAAVAISLFYTVLKPKRRFRFLTLPM
jgi:hypothetical protein